VQKHKPPDAADKNKKEKKAPVLTEEQALLRKTRPDLSNTRLKVRDLM
jgi:hypothetical protein